MNSYPRMVRPAVTKTAEANRVVDIQEVDAVD